MREAVEWRSARLRSIRDLTPDIRLFAFEPSGAFVRPSPGSHINVTVYPEGRPDTRSYSIVAPSADGVYRIAVKRLPESRGGSAYMWTLAPGAQVLLSTPGNHFELGLGKPGLSPRRRRHRHHADLHDGARSGAGGARFRLLYAVRSRAGSRASPTSCAAPSATDSSCSSSGEGSRIDLDGRDRSASRRTANSMSAARSDCSRTARRALAGERAAGGRAAFRDFRHRRALCDGGVRRPHPAPRPGHRGAAQPPCSKRSRRPASR